MHVDVGHPTSREAWAYCSALSPYRNAGRRELDTSLESRHEGRRHATWILYVLTKNGQAACAAAPHAHGVLRRSDIRGCVIRWA